MIMNRCYTCYTYVPLRFKEITKLIAFPITFFKVAEHTKSPKNRAEVEGGIVHILAEFIAHHAETAKEIRKLEAAADMTIACTKVGDVFLPDSYFKFSLPYFWLTFDHTHTHTRSYRFTNRIYFKPTSSINYTL